MKLQAHLSNSLWLYRHHLRAVSVEGEFNIIATKLIALKRIDETGRINHKFLLLTTPQAIHNYNMK
jgi:hypothetical protein